MEFKFEFLNPDTQKVSRCYYQNDTEQGKAYGRIYNWYAVNDPRGLCPEGWHVPTNEVSGSLFIYLSGVTEAKLPDSKDARMFIWGRGVQFENKDVMRCGKLNG